MDEQKILYAVERAAQNYLWQGDDHTIKITKVWIDKPEHEGEITVKVSCVSEEAEDIDDMIYTVSDVGNGELNIHGPEW